MRWTGFIILQIVIVVIIGGIVYVHKDRVAVTKRPPASLADWYRPENKRQVWLHNMFSLRCEMQAVRFYAGNASPDNEYADHLEKWVGRLSEHYIKIGEMVPEWEAKLDKKTMMLLNESVSDRRYGEVSQALDELDKNCNSCHVDFQSITATAYRAPDFSTMEIASIPYKKFMDQLTQHVNKVKIAGEDGMQDLALTSFGDLKKGIHQLGETCSTCHEKDIRVYPDEPVRDTLDSLEQSLATGTIKEQGRDLGTLAVLACARCHGTHRIAYHNRKAILEGPDWPTLIKH